MVKIDKVFTVKKKLAVMKIGSVNDMTFKKIRNKLLEIF